MRVIRENFKIIIEGKCTTKEDIIQLFNFGFKKEGIVKKFRKDNKMKIEDARQVVEKTLFEELVVNRKES